MSRKPHIIAFGNEKGGSGKSTTAMHVFVALARRGLRVGALDLDLRQKSFFRYIDNRQNWCERKGVELVLPKRVVIEASTHADREKSWAIEGERFKEALEKLGETCDVILIDCPGAHSNLSRLGHSRADTLVTPMNDSFIDFDLLARVDPKDFTIAGPSVYSEMVWETRKLRAQIGLGPTDWVVVRNRMPLEDAANKRRVGAMLEQLSKRIGFRVSNGLSERPIFREMFLSGLTLMDLRDTGESMDMSKIAARQEVRELMKTLDILPETKPDAAPEPEQPIEVAATPDADAAPEAQSEATEPQPEPVAATEPAPEPEPVAAAEPAPEADPTPEPVPEPVAAFAHEPAPNPVAEPEHAAMPAPQPPAPSPDLVAARADETRRARRKRLFGFFKRGA